MIPILIGALGTVAKGLLRGLEELEIRGRAETIQTTATRILQRVLETCRHLQTLMKDHMKILQVVVVVVTTTATCLKILIQITVVVKLVTFVESDPKAPF